MMQEMRKALRSEGLTMQPIKTRAPYLRGYGFAPDVIFDVGVDTGSAWLYRCFPAARCVLLDPMPGVEEAVRAKGDLADFDFHAVALGAEAGEATLTVPVKRKGPAPGMASLLAHGPRAAKAFVGSETYGVPVRTLDSVAQAYPGRAGLRIDAQGSERAILQGAAATLDRCDFVVLPIPVTRLFEGAAAPSEIIALLARAGFELRDMLRVSAGSGKIARPRYLDCLFTRWTS
jgi:FkbM family methyltransferase